MENLFYIELKIIKLPDNVILKSLSILVVGVVIK